MTKRLTGRCVILLLCAVLALGLFTATALAEGEITTDVLYPFAGITMHAHGTLTADKETAGAGETVTLTLETDEGYGLKTGGITAYAYLNGVQQDAITVTGPTDGPWTFTMPDGNYTVTAFAEIEWQKAPPSGTKMPYFYIDGTMTGGGVSAGSIPKLTPPLSAGDLYTPTVTQITMTANPDEGYVLKGWEVITVNSSGEPFLGYSLPAERNGSTYMLDFQKVNNNYIFRIRAIFEEAPQPIAINAAATEKPGTINRGSTLTASCATAYEGDQITLTASPVEGAKLSAVPQIWYTPREVNELGTNTSYITPTQDGNTFTFTVPQGISPNDANIYITASFEDDSYSISTPENQDEKILKVTADKAAAAKGETVTLTAVAAGNVTFNPADNLTVSWTDGNSQTHAVPFTLTETVNLAARIYYTCTFTMPAHDVSVSANCAQKAYSITRTDVTGITPAANRPETTITVAGFDVSTDHVYARANERDAVALEVTAPNGYGNSKLTVRGIYYTLDDDPSGTHYDLTLTFDKYRNPSASFAMPAGDITLHYVTGTAYEVSLDTENTYGTASVDNYYAFQGDTITVTGTPDTAVYPHDRLACTAKTVAQNPEDVEVTVANGSGTYSATFTMPDAPVIVTPEFQMENVPYYRYSYTGGTLTGTQETAVRYYTLSSGQTELTGGLYVARENISWNSSLTISGDTDMILTDGVTLSANGVVISGTSKLTIYGQAQSSGQLISNGAKKNPGISLMGGGTLSIHGGVIKAKGHSHDSNGDAGGAGIGGSDSADMNGTLYVYGGTVEATGGTRMWDEPYHNYEDSDYYYYSSGGAGIGGGGRRGGGTVVVYGGIVRAQAGSGAGIGAGTNQGPSVGHDNEKGANVTILGGYVKATPRCLYISGSSDYNYEAIGGKKNSGSLNLGGNMKVKVNGQVYSGSTAVEKARSKAQIIISADPSGESPVMPTHSIVFGSGSENAGGSMADVIIPDSVIYQLPECGFTAPEGMIFREWAVVIGSEFAVNMNPGDEITVTENLILTAVWEVLPVFGDPDFVIPADTTTIEASAFEDIAATIVEIPDNCTFIGNYAFRNCTSLTQIRIPADCELGTDVFDGCTKVYIFGTAGSPAEAYCSAPGHSNCVFTEEAQ